MKFKSLLAVVAALSFAVNAVNADPDVIQVDTDLVGGIADNISGPHNFGSFEVFDSVGFPGGAFTVDVFSGPSDRPGWDFEVTEDFANFGTGDFIGGTASYSLQGIKAPGTNAPIDDVAVKNGFGQPMPNVTVNFDGGNIFVNGLVDDLIGGGDVITIQWTQVPEPASLSLLAIGGAAILRRRRNR
jgi:hypothetical protein